MKNKNMNGLINKIADLKNISFYSAKTDKNLLIKLIIKNSKNLLNKIELDGNGYLHLVSTMDMGGTVQLLRKNHEK